MYILIPVIVAGIACIITAVVKDLRENRAARYSNHLTSTLGRRV